MANRYCDALGIPAPTLERVRRHPDANTYSLLIVALLERGGPMTLREVAERFDTAGIAAAEQALRSLQRCKPGRAPVYRDGELYALDPHDDELDLWAFRLGLRPARAPRLSVVRGQPGPPPGPDVSLEIDELDEAWRGSGLTGWPAYRLALAVLDAHGSAMRPDEVVAFVAARSEWHGLSPDSRKFLSRGSRVRVTDDGSWAIGDDQAALESARQAVRDRIRMLRRQAGTRMDPAVLNALRKAHERRQAKHAAELAALRRVLVHTFPVEDPKAVVVVDIAARKLKSYLDEQLDEARRRITEYDFIAAVDVRRTLRRLDLDPGSRRLAELGPPQKSKTLNRRGRTLKIANTMLVQGSCGIARPFGDPNKMAAYLRTGQTTRLRRRLEADAKSLFALYAYGMLHGAVRLRWGFLDEMIPAPWRHRDEPGLRDLERRALEHHRTVEVVVGSAPGWSDPWARAERCHVRREGDGYSLSLIGEDGLPIEARDVQAARLAGEAGM